MSREQQFLADADATLLTRDPEGLALALVKVCAKGDVVRVTTDDGRAGYILRSALD